MKIGALVKYSLYLMIMIFVTSLILTVYLYFFSTNQAVEVAYNFVVPLCMFVASLLYSRSTHEKGLLRGMEIWMLYFAVIFIIKFIMKSADEINILQNLIYLPISIIGGVIGVNIK